MYSEIGAFDAKAKLSELLRKVKDGQHFTITVRGQPIAHLVPCNSNAKQNSKQAIADMFNIKKISGVSAKLIAELITEGRR